MTSHQSEKPPSGVEVLQQWKAEHFKCRPRWEDGSTCLSSTHNHCDSCKEPWPCPMSRLVEQIEKDREAMLSIEWSDTFDGVSYCPSCGAARDRHREPCILAEALTLSRLEAR